MGEFAGGRPVTFSLPEDLSRKLFSLPLGVGENPADHVRAAVDEYIERRAADPALPGQIQAALAQLNLEDPNFFEPSPKE